MKKELEHGASALPAISVIVPVYNAEKYLHRCIDSILAQTFTDFELLLIDDGSKDKSGAICDEYADKDSRVRVFHKENGGVSSARNAGLDNVRGEWVAFLDADDYFLSNGLEILLYTALERKAKVSAANFYVEKDNKRYGQCEGQSRIVKDNFRAWYFMTCYPRAGAALFHVTAIKHKSFDESLSRYEDAKFLFLIMREYKIAYSSNYVMVYTDEGDGLSKQTPSHSKNFVFSINCLDGSFWEKIVYVRLIKREMAVYKEYDTLIGRNNKTISMFILIEQLISFLILPVSMVNRVFRKLGLYQ